MNTQLKTILSSVIITLAILFAISNFGLFLLTCYCLLYFYCVYVLVRSNLHDPEGIVILTLCFGTLFLSFLPFCLMDELKNHFDKKIKQIWTLCFGNKTLKFQTPFYLKENIGHTKTKY